MHKVQSFAVAETFEVGPCFMHWNGSLKGEQRFEPEDRVVQITPPAAIGKSALRQVLASNEAVDQVSRFTEQFR